MEGATFLYGKFGISQCQACLFSKALPLKGMPMSGEYSGQHESNTKRVAIIASMAKKSGTGKMTKSPSKKQLLSSSKQVPAKKKGCNKDAPLDAPTLSATGNAENPPTEKCSREELIVGHKSNMVITKASQTKYQNALYAEGQSVDVIDATENYISLAEVEGISLSSDSMELGAVKKGLDASRKSNLDFLEKTKKAPEEYNLSEHDREDERTQVAHVEGKMLDLKFFELKTCFGNKIVFYPQTVLAASEVQIFFNCSISALVNQPRIVIMGAFNDWRWAPFTIDLHKSHLPGDWWVCCVQVPREAYKIDFVFFNGEHIYENNTSKDFSMPIEGGMGTTEFENFLIEEKRKEAEYLAAEQAEKDRIAVEARKLAEKLAAEEADKAEAIRITKEQRESAQLALRKAQPKIEGVWKFGLGNFHAGGSVKLYYNRSSGPLAFCKDVWVHGGYNNWKDLVSIVKKLSPAELELGDWWCVEVQVPERAYMLNWVFAEGPPNSAKLYDNNNHEDFHALVPKCMPEDLYWAANVEEVFRDLSCKRQEQEKAKAEKDERRARTKLEMKRKSKQARLKSQAHAFYTVPEDVKAGQVVNVFYNPSSTILKGKEEVWIRYSFNHWTHTGSFPSCKMNAVGDGTHLQACVSIPLDAYVMDFVFSERGDMNGGAYDNRNGLDYHIPITGGTAQELPLNVVHVAVEMAPVAKVGGLADVVTSLSRAVQELGHNVEVIIPKYDCLDYNYVHDLEENSHFNLGPTRVKVWSGNVEGLKVTFLEPENGMFWAGCIYGRRDDANRFDFFSRASLEFLLRRGKNPDIIHCHDWSSAPVAWLFQEGYKHYGLSKARVVFTIHNLEFGANIIGKAMSHANKATTVSETYASEVSGSPVVAPYLHKFYGIRNGIDFDLWDPYSDSFIPINYDMENLIEGKQAAKAELQHKLGLQKVDRPLVSVVTRLTAQKGINLIKHGIWRTLERGGQVVLLGSAPDPRVHNEFVNLGKQLEISHPAMSRLCLTYDEPLSHLIYAGADFVFIPSIFEPCGLTQLIAMRYGTIPVVRKTGGLRDTVYDVDHDKDRANADGIGPNGFSFEGTDAPSVDYSLNRALSSWYEARDWMHELCKQVMEQDWTWSRPALDYVDLYHASKSNL